jgi:hypothetical protein
VPNPDLLAIVRSLQATQFRDLAGAQVTARVPVAARLINEVVALTLPTNVPIREARVRPIPGDRFSVRVTPRSAFLPSLTVRLDIERQPELPGSPVLVLRLATLAGLFGLAAAAFPIAQMLPPGVRMDGELIHVDLRAMAEQHGFSNEFQYLRQLRVTTEEGRVLLHLEASVPE